MREFEPLSFDRALASTAREFERRGKTGEPLGDALPPLLLDEEALYWLRELRHKDPLAAALEAWLLRLREQAEFDEQRRELARVHREQRHAISKPETSWLSLSEMRERALCRPAQRVDYLRNYFASCDAVAGGVRRLWEERHSFAERLAASLDSFEVLSPALAQAAERVLAGTRDAFDSLEIRDPAALITAALAEAANEGWPARLNERTTFELLADPTWFHGLRVRPFKIPQALGAASFSLALARAGRALSAAAAALRSPFVLASDVFDWRQSSLGALLALLPLSTTFAERRLGVSPSKLGDQQRVLARAALVDLRVAAYRVLLRGLLLRGGVAVERDVPELSLQALGFELPMSVAGVFIRARPRDSQRLAGALWASSRHEALVQAHDDDWFRNPRAIAELRAELGEPALELPNDDAWASGLHAFQARVDALL